MIVSELDPLMETYTVFDRGENIGEKSKLFGYMKPEWSRGIRRYKTFDERRYKTTPPWFKLEVEEITCGGGISIHIKKKEEKK